MDINEKIDKKEAQKILKENHNKLVKDDMDSFVSLSHINKVYPNGVQAVYNFNLDVNPHEFIALVGPSGCGKSTTLRMIAGLEEITSGELFINHIYSNYLPSKDRDIAMVFQSYALYPQMTVYDNIAFGLKLRHVKKEEIEKQVYQAADILDLGPYLDRKPKELSGGQMQRVALGRAIVRNAKLFLMDEPLSNLDAKLRVQMRSEIVRIHEQIGATTIYVTHDQTEAMTMATRIVVMNKGFIQQIGTPIEIYHQPKNLFVATFIGTPMMNILDVEYNDGILFFKDGSKLKLKEDEVRRYQIYLTRKIQRLRELRDKASDMKLEDLMNEYLPFVAYKNTFAKKNEKQKWYQKITGIFKKNTKDNSDDCRATILGKIGELITEYEGKMNTPHKINFGIRPENVHVIDNGIKVKTNIVEILGNEFIAYSEGELGKLTIKSSENILSHHDIQIEFEDGKYYLFDEISEENVLLSE